MDINEYQQYVADGASDKYKNLGFATLALVGEVGEVCDVIKKSEIYDASKQYSDYELKLVDEMGDVLWQYMAILNTLGISIDAIIAHNIQKLNARHGGAKLDTTGGKR